MIILPSKWLAQSFTYRNTIYWCSLTECVNPIFRSSRDYPAKRLWLGSGVNWWIDMWLALTAVARLIITLANWQLVSSSTGQLLNWSWAQSIEVIETYTPAHTADLWSGRCLPSPSANNIQIYFSHTVVCVSRCSHRPTITLLITLPIPISIPIPSMSRSSPARIFRSGSVLVNFHMTLLGGSLLLAAPRCWLLCHNFRKKWSAQPK